MADPNLMPIGTFAKRAGLTASALRFYDDAGLLRPELVDSSTGYRHYNETQLVRAAQLRQLRAIAMPLPAIARFFVADPDEAAQLLDEHLAATVREAAEIQQVGATLRASLQRAADAAVGVVPGPALAAAVDQVLATTISDPSAPILSGVRVESGPDAISLAATDRYRLAIRTLVPTHPGTAPWAGTLVGDDLRSVSSRLRRSPLVTMTAGRRTLDMHLSDGTVANTGLLTDPFPDCSGLLSALPTITHRVRLLTLPAVRLLEQRAPEWVGLWVTNGQLQLLLPDADAVGLDGSATGPDVTVWFEVTTLYPALSQALGSEVMLDLRGPDQPATVRSADDGDLTTLVMPRRVPNRSQRTSGRRTSGRPS